MDDISKKDKLIKEKDKKDLKKWARLTILSIAAAIILIFSLNLPLILGIKFIGIIFYFATIFFPEISQTYCQTTFLEKIGKLSKKTCETLRGTILFILIFI